MNRPKKKDYPEVIKIINGVVTTYISDKYTEDLEKYCNALEDRCSRDDLNLHLLDKDCTKLGKALDKACDYLARYGNGDTFVKMNNAQWKEWLMKDE